MTNLNPTAYRKPLSGGKAKQLIVLLHGWGADGPNLIDIGDAIAPAFPDAHFISPNAPFVCEVNPYGFQWFSLIDRNPSKMLEGARTAAEILNRFLDEQLAALSLDNSKLALIGFSQGTMTALYTAVRRSPQIAGMVGFSGALIGADELALETKSKPPICLIHGTIDDVVPYASMKAAEDALANVGIKPQTHSRPNLGHGIDMEGIRIAAAFLQDKF